MPEPSAAVPLPSVVLEAAWRDALPARPLRAATVRHNLTVLPLLYGELVAAGAPGTVAAGDPARGCRYSGWTPIDEKRLQGEYAPIER